VAIFASLFVADRAPLRAVQLAMLGAGVLYLAAAAVVALGRSASSTARFRTSGPLPSIDPAR
jgi:hypothetical protein